MTTSPGAADTTIGPASGRPPAQVLASSRCLRADSGCLGASATAVRPGAVGSTLVQVVSGSEAAGPADGENVPGQVRARSSAGRRPPPLPDADRRSLAGAC